MGVVDTGNGMAVLEGAAKEAESVANDMRAMQSRLDRGEVPLAGCGAGHELTMLHHRTLSALSIGHAALLRRVIEDEKRRVEGEERQKKIAADENQILGSLQWGSKKATGVVAIILVTGGLIWWSSWAQNKRLEQLTSRLSALQSMVIESEEMRAH